jgi:hypothetical protein
MTNSNRAASIGISLIVLLATTTTPAWAQIDLSGEWAGLLHEDIGHRFDNPDPAAAGGIRGGGGPQIGDYTGLPINAAARLRADSWDASMLSAPEHQATPGPSVYTMRSGSMRISKIVDEDTQQVVAFKIFRSPGNNGTTRMIWMDGRPHPPEYAAHTWQGFSTGAWDGNTLTVQTSHLKASWIQRNGVPSSDRATMTEHFVRHGGYLTVVSIVYDAVYLEEPFIRSTTYVLDLDQQLRPVKHQIVDEIAGRPDGYLPHHLPGSNDQLTEFADRVGLPFEATRGGKETTYPEYQATLPTLVARTARKVTR